MIDDHVGAPVMGVVVWVDVAVGDRRGLGAGVAPRFDIAQVVTDGLKPGEQVVIEGMQKLRQGMTVKTTPWKMPPGFDVEPNLPAPEPPPADGDYMLEPPKAALEGAPAPEVPVVPGATPAAAPEASPVPTPTPLPEASATPA